MGTDPRASNKQAVRLHAEAAGFHVGDGIKYGLDFLLYTDEPGRVHSKYGVVVREGRMSYRELVMCQRMCAGVKKEFLLAGVDGRGRVRFMRCQLVAV